MKVLQNNKMRESPPNAAGAGHQTVWRRRPRAVRLPTDPSVVRTVRRAHAGTAVPQAPEALTGSPELPSLGDRGTTGLLQVCCATLPQPSHGPPTVQS